MYKKTLSIIILTYNNFDEIFDTYFSVPVGYRSSVFVVNGGSCEKTKQFLIDNKIENLTEKDNGIADAFNKGVLNTKGEWIHFLNSGDILINFDFYESIKKSSKYDFIYGNIVFQDSLLGGVVRGVNHSKGKNLAEGVPFNHQALMVKRTVFDRVGLFNTSYRVGMDYDWELRVLRVTRLGFYFSQPVVAMDGLGISSKNEEIGFKERIKSLRENNLMNYTCSVYLLRDYLKIKLKKILLRIGGESIVRSVRIVLNRN